MAINLVSLPVEILHRICKHLPASADVTNFRLVCHLLADVGLNALAPAITFRLSPESIARLRDISLHPVLRYYVSTVVCALNILEPYHDFAEWKQKTLNPDVDEWESDAEEDEQVLSDAELAQGWSAYLSLLAGQEEACHALGPSHEVQQAYERLPNLRHLEFKYFNFTDFKDQSSSLYKSLDSRHISGSSHDPFYPFEEGSEFIGRPGINLLRSFLGVAHPKVSSLRVAALDTEYFSSDETELDAQTSNLGHFRSMQLGIVSPIGDPTQAEARRNLSSGRLKSFVSSAACLEDLKLSFATNIGELYLANITSILPTAQVWPALRELHLKGAELLPSHFLDFFSSHSQTLQSLSLCDCELVADGAYQALGAGHQHRWSSIFIPLATTYSLKTLSLSGRFLVSRPIGELDIVPFINSRDTVQGMDLHVGEAIEMVVCSEDLDSFLRREVKGPSSAVESVKRGIVADLMDHPPTRTEVPRTEEIPTRYLSLLKAFSLVTDSSGWGKWWRPHPKTKQKELQLLALEVPRQY